MLPVPLAAGIVAPPLTTAVQVAPAGKLSVTVCPVASLTPVLLIVTVYVVLVPAVYVVVPSVFVSTRSGSGFGVSVSVWVLFAVASPVGVLTVAVFTTLPVWLLAIGTTIV